MSIKIEVKDLKAGQYITFETKSDTTRDGMHQVEVVGFLYVGMGTEGGIYDVVVREEHHDGNLLELLSSYDSNFYELNQEYIEVFGSWFL